MHDDPPLSALLAAVADGSPVDWARAESSASSPEARGVVQQLRVLAELAAVHRDVADRDVAEQEGTAAHPDESAWSDDVTVLQGTANRWAHLDFLERIGEGTFGTVYRAWDGRLDREVALKLLNDTRVRDFSSSVIKEGRLLARVRHPNVITVYGADRVQGQVGIWMELLKGRTLKQVLQDHGVFGAKEAALVGLDLCHALAAVHQVGLVHRDIKAQNVMREDGGRLVLMDFGAGEELAATSPSQAPSLTGTPLYMAPELFDGRIATPQTDIYSIGVLLYHLTTASYPVEAGSMIEVAAAHARGARRWLRDRRPDLPDDFVRVIEQALSSDPDARPQSAGAMEAKLAATLERPAGSAGVLTVRPAEHDTPAAGIEAPAIPDRDSRIARRWVPALLTAGLLVAAALVVPRLGGKGEPVAPVPAARPINSLAVLPLTNLSGDPAQDYFVDGMTELLITDLSQISALRVISRTSAMTFKASKQPLPDIARALNVDAIVAGSVTRDGDRLRVTLQVIEAGTDFNLWSNTYERPVRDAFTLQSEVVRDIAREIKIAIRGPEQQQLGVPRPAPPEAVDAYLRGRSLMALMNRERMPEACRELEQAVSLAPAYAQAHASLARCFVVLEGFALLSPREARARVDKAAAAALAGGGAAAEAHTALAELKFRYDWDWRGAEQSYRDALRANPGYSHARTNYARFLSAAGRTAEAVAEARRAEESDPLSPEIKGTVGLSLYYERRYDEAIAVFKSSLALNPSRPPARLSLGRAYAAKGQFKEALAEINEAIRLSGQEPAYISELGRTYAVSGERGRAEAVLAQLAALEAAGQTIAPQDYAYIHAALGHHVLALNYLEAAVAAGGARVLWLKVDPRVDALRGEARFKALLRRLGVPE